MIKYDFVDNFRNFNRKILFDLFLSRIFSKKFLKSENTSKRSVEKFAFQIFGVKIKDMGLCSKCPINVEDFYVKITTDPKTKKRFGKQQIPRHTRECYRESNISIVDIGHNVREYTLKEYGNGTSHELLTMFVQLMFSNPYRVVKESPEFFAGMMKCLK